MRLGDDKEARRLEQVVEDFGMEGYDAWLRPSEVALAVARGDLSTLARMLEDWKPEGFADVEGLVTWLDAFVALDRVRPQQLRPPGFFFALFFALYGPGRFALDFLRVGEARYVGLTPAQWLMAGAAIAALAWLSRSRGRARQAAAER